MADAKITRLDVAIDILNLALADLFVYYSKGHKVWTVSSNHGGIQTQQFYTDKQHSASLSPKKRANLIAYDKRQEQKDRGNKPLYAELEHIRIEPSLKKYNSLIGLKNTKFPLSGWSFQNIISKNRPIRIKRWRAFKDSVRIRGVEAAEKLLDKAEFEKYFAEKYTNFAKNIVTEEVWSHWPEAIERAYIGLLIEWAQTPPEKFIPPGLLSKGA
ncbi:MAG: hypothetical protein COA85_03255 [Robiginitomaculum sp.]|nr:MAG: hypothetical protein COA85_03255 [Robiginitomaculum sp.]